MESNNTDNSINIGSLYRYANGISYVGLDKKYIAFSSILQHMGQETYVVLAFSQVTIMCINHLFTLNPLLKYTILIIALILLTYFKDGINQLSKIKIL